MRKLPLRLYAVAFGAWSCLFFAACGLDQVYLLEPPTAILHNVYVDTDSPAQWYVEFITNDTGNAAYYPSRGNSFVFLGTEIYYKIYNNKNTLQSHKNSINSVNTASYYSEAASRMITTYHYQTLGLKPELGWTPFVGCDETGNKRVYIRLTDVAPDGNTETFKAGVKFNDTDKNVVPYRNGNRYSFDFFNKAQENPRVTNIQPSNGDADYYHSNSDDGKYYVHLYAVAVGRDSNYTPSYSPVLDLGVIPILNQ